MPSSSQPCIFGYYSLVVGARQSISVLQSRLDYSLALRCWNVPIPGHLPASSSHLRHCLYPSCFCGALVLFAASAFARVTLRRELSSFCLLSITLLHVIAASTLHHLFTSHLEATKRILNSKGIAHHRWLHGTFNVSFYFKNVVSWQDKGVGRVF